MPGLELTHLPLDNRAAILADILKHIFFNENYRIPIQTSLKFVHVSRIDNKPALVQVMAWHWTGEKPLSLPMVTQLTVAYIRHYAALGGREFNQISKRGPCTEIISP